MLKRSHRKTTVAAKKKRVKKRPPIPTLVERAILLGNRHACCVCQKPRVQLHHIDGNPSHNDPSNIAALCLDHHDMATMQIGLTKKLQPNEVRNYKQNWEKRCRNDITALSRKRFTFYYCIYKNPQRLLSAYVSLAEQERKLAVERLKAQLADEEPRKKDDQIFGLNAVPRMDQHTLEALKSIYVGETAPSYLQHNHFKWDPSRPYASHGDFMAFHKYDLWCQILGQTLAEAKGTTPLEDLYKFKTAKEIDSLAGSLVTFRLTVRGKDIHIPKAWKEFPTGSLQARAKLGERSFRIAMTVRNQGYLLGHCSN